MAYLEGQLRENASEPGDDEHTGYVLEIEVGISQHIAEGLNR